MTPAIVIDRICADMPGTPRCRRISEAEEGFLFYQDGALATALPGRELDLTCENSADLLVLRKGARTEGFAGASGALGGWVSYECELISPRRFADRLRDQLTDDEAARAALTARMRSSLSDTFRSAEACEARGRMPASGEVWSSARRAAERSFLDCGWRLTAFRPQHLQYNRS